MGKDALRKRPIREAVIHEPRKGILPKKSCLKKRSDSLSPAAFPTDAARGHKGENTSRSNGGPVAASVGRQEEKLQDDILATRIRQDADLPRDRNPRWNRTQHTNARPGSDSEQTHSPYRVLKRKKEEADEANDRSVVDAPRKMAKMSRDELRKYIKQKVQDANRALVLEDMAGKLSQCARRKHHGRL
jgi:hypothetical protein